MTRFRCKYAYLSRRWSKNATVLKLIALERFQHLKCLLKVIQGNLFDKLLVLKVRGYAYEKIGYVKIRAYFKKIEYAYDVYAYSIRQYYTCA